MNANRIKFFSLFAELSRAPADAVYIGKYMKALLALDYAAAAEVWEYLTSVYPDNPLYGDMVFRLFYAKSPKAAVKFVKETPSVRRSVFGLSDKAGEGELLGIVAEALLAGKTDDADELIRCVAKNASVPFGPYMKTLVEKLFVEILKKNNNTRIAVPKKVSALLLSHIAKIKTDERALLEQRLKEIS